MAGKNLTKEAILQAVESSKATSISQIYRSLGGKGNISGSTAKRIRELVPDVDATLKINKQANGDGKAEAKATAKIPKKASRNSKFPRHPKNPFREGSAYATAVNILAAHKTGMRRDDLLKLTAQETLKSEKKCSYDLAVVLSARESPTGPRHKSCREGYWVEREHDHVRIRFE